MIVKKSAAEIEEIAAAGEILAEVLAHLATLIKPGVRTEQLDREAERLIRARGATPTFKGYHGFPASICASPNGVVVHGIPGRYRLQAGDVISIDVGVTYRGWVADAARTFAVGRIERRTQALLAATERALYAGIAKAQPGSRLGAVSAAIQAEVESAGFSVVRQLVGHGVGRQMHEDPQVPNFGSPDSGPILEEGMVLAIEPMTTAGSPAVRIGADGWTVFTADGSVAAHFEHTVAVTAEGPRILTPWHRAAAREGLTASASTC